MSSPNWWCRLRPAAPSGNLGVQVDRGQRVKPEMPGHAWKRRETVTSAHRRTKDDGAPPA